MPPPINRTYKGAARGGRLLLTDQAVAWKQTVGLILNVMGPEPTTDRVAVKLVYYRKQRSGDIDSRIKITLDALQGHFFVNDSQIDELIVSNRKDAQDPRVEVTITRLPSE